METELHTPCTAFLGGHRVACGTLMDVVRQISDQVPVDQRASVLIFNDQCGKRIDVDWRQDGGSFAIEQDPANGTVPRGPGRPRLGVVAREITLLPRHWAWLNAQPGGASVALRKLVEDARRQGGVSDRKRRAQEAGYGFMSCMAGDLPGFEDAARALFAGRRVAFTAVLEVWPEDIATYAARLCAGAFD